MQGNTSCHRIPSGHHALLGFGRLFTDGTARIVGSQLSEAVPMNGMSTGHFVTGRSGGEQIFLTDGAVGLVLAHLAIVILVEGAINAHAAIMAVLKVFRSSDAAKAAVWTVIRTFFVRHPEVANDAVVGSELNAAVDAVVSEVRKANKQVRKFSMHASNDQCHVG